MSSSTFTYNNNIYQRMWDPHSSEDPQEDFRIRLRYIRDNPEKDERVIICDLSKMVLVLNPEQAQDYILAREQMNN